MTRITDQASILGQRASLDPRLGRRPLGLARLHLGVGNVHVDAVRLGVNGHGVAVAHQRNGPAHGRLGDDVPDNEPVRRAAVPAVGHERDVGQPRAHDGRRRPQLLRHAGPSLGALVAHDDDEVAVLAADLPLAQRRVEVALAVVHAGFAREAQPFLAGDFGDGASRSKVAAQDADVAARLDGVVERADDLLARVERGPVGDVGGERLARHRHDGAVNDVFGDEHLEHRRGAAHLVEVLHEVLAARRQVCEVRGAVAGALDVVEAQRDPRRVGHGQEVQHAVGRAAEDHGQDQRVLKGGARHEVPRAEVLGHGRLDDLGGALALARLFRGQRRVRRRAGEREAHGFNRRGHGVGRVHAATGTGAGAGVMLEIGQDVAARAAGLAGVCGGVQTAVRVGACCLVACRDVNFLFKKGRVALADRATVDHYKGSVVSCGRHDDARHILVAAGDGDVGIVVLRACNGLDGVGNDFARLEREAHAYVVLISWVKAISTGPKPRTVAAHGDGVGNANGVELPTEHAFLFNRALHNLAKVQH